MTKEMFDIIDEYAVSAELDTAYELMNDCIKNATIMEQYGYDEMPDEVLMEAATTDDGPGFGTRVRARHVENRVKAGRAIDEANERLERRPGEKMLTRFLLFLPRLIMAIINFFRWLIRRLTSRRRIVQSAATAVSNVSSQTRSRIRSNWSATTFTSSIKSGKSLSVSVRSALSGGHQLPGPGSSTSGSGSKPTGPDSSHHQLPGPSGSSRRSGSNTGPDGGSSSSKKGLPLKSSGNQMPPATASGSFESWANQAKSTNGLKKDTPIKELVDERFSTIASNAVVTGKFKGLPILNKKFITALNQANEALMDLEDWCGKLDRADNKVTTSGGHINDHGDKYSVEFSHALNWSSALRKKAEKMRKCYNNMADTVAGEASEKASFTSQQLLEAYDLVSKALDGMYISLQKLQKEVNGSGDSQLSRIVKALQKKSEELDPRSKNAYMSSVKELAEALTKMKDGVVATSQGLDYTVHCCELILEMIKQAGGKIESQRTVGFSTAMRNERGELRDSEKMSPDD